MKIEIKNRFTGKIIFPCEAKSLLEANVWEADLWKVDLRGLYLRESDLRGANFRRANFRGSDFQGSDLRGANFWGSNLRESDLRESDLRGVNLWEADLQEADLRGANLDYSCWPLSCKSLGVKVDVKIAMQLAAHFCVLVCEDKKYLAAREAIFEFAKESHRARELGLIKGGKEK